ARTSVEETVDDRRQRESRVGEGGVFRPLDDGAKVDLAANLKRVLAARLGGEKVLAQRAGQAALILRGLLARRTFSGRLGLRFCAGRGRSRVRGGAAEQLRLARARWRLRGAAAGRGCASIRRATKELLLSRTFLRGRKRGGDDDRRAE